MDLLNEEEPKENKVKKIIKTLLIVSIISIIITVTLIVVLSNKPEIQVSKKDKIFVDEQEKELPVQQILLINENGDMYLAIKDLATLVEYNYFNGEYLKYTEDRTKCYIESIIEKQVENINNEKTTIKTSNIVGLEANSNKIYKTNSKSELDYEFIEIKNPILLKDDKLYISFDDVGVALGIYANYSEQNGLQICTAKYLTEFYNNKAKENGYNSINVEDSNYRTIAYNTLIINKNEKYGIVDSNFNELVGAKYSNILFSEYNFRFIVSNGSKYGIIDEEGNIKVNLIYDEIAIINYTPLLYKVKNENKYGIMNDQGNLITSLIYDEIGYKEEKESEIEYATTVIPELEEDIKQSIVVKQSTGYGLVDAETGIPIVECNLEKIYYAIRDGEKIYEAILKGQRIDLIQYIKYVKTIVVTI